MSFGRNLISGTLMSKGVDKRRIHPLQRNTNILLNSFLSSYGKSTNAAALSKAGHQHISGNSHTTNACHRTNTKTKDQIPNNYPSGEKSYNHVNYQRTNMKTEPNYHYQRVKKINNTCNRQEGDSVHKTANRGHSKFSADTSLPNTNSIHEKKTGFKKPIKNSNLFSDAKRQYENNNFPTDVKRKDRQRDRQIQSDDFRTDAKKCNQNNISTVNAKKKVQYQHFSNFRANVNAQNKNYYSCTNGFKEIKNTFEVYKEFGKLPLYCEICDVKVSDVEPLMEHFNCKNHHKNMNSPNLKNHINFAEYHRRLELIKQILNMRKNNVYGCELCEVTFSTRIKLTLHKRSKDHQKVLLAQSVLLGRACLGLMLMA